MAQSVSDQEYRNLTTPGAALAQLVSVGIDASAAKTAITERLANGRVQAVAQRAFVASIISGEQAHDRMRIARGAWAGVEIPDEFWDGKDLRLPRTGEAAAHFGLGAFHDGPMVCLGVRLVPLDIDIIASDHHQARAAAAESRQLSERVPVPEAPPEEDDLAALAAKAMAFPRSPMSILSERFGAGTHSRAQQISRAPPPIVPLRGYAAAAPKYPTEISRLGPNEVTLAEYAKRTKALARKGAPARRKKRASIPVSHDEFMAWYGALPTSDQARGYRWVWREAERHFMPRTGVRKKWAEELSRGRGPGRKTTG